MKGSAWFAETSGEETQVLFRYRRILYSGQSEYQKIEIVDTIEYGRTLFLDGVVNSSEADEYVYHEALVHPALLTHPSPEKVCVIGGAEGATVREVLRHPSVRRVVMVDIDAELVELCRELLPDMNGGAFDDPRLEMVYGDGRAYLAGTDERFDAILVDLSDPVPGSPAVLLFTREFYQLVHDRLTDEGAACVQGESLHPRRLEMHGRMTATLKDVFPFVRPFQYYAPSFFELLSHILTARSGDPDQIDLAGRLIERDLDLRYLTPELLDNLFVMPGYVEEAYPKFDRILTDESLLTMLF